MCFFIKLFNNKIHPSRYSPKTNTIKTITTTNGISFERKNTLLSN